MSKDNHTGNPHVRRIKPGEPAAKRSWPGKKWRNSEQPVAVVKPGQKSRIHSVLTALPVLMLLIGLYVYYSGERAQNSGMLLLDEKSSLAGQVERLTGLNAKPGAQRYLWVAVDGRSRGFRFKADQGEALSVLNKGDTVSIDVAPRVSGSRTLWLYSLAKDGVDVIPAQP